MKTQNLILHLHTQVSKLYAYWITKYYRDAYNIFACNGILFNHESPRRGETFITRKITIGLSKILNGKQKLLRSWKFELIKRLGMQESMQKCNGLCCKIKNQMILSYQLVNNIL